MKTVDKIRNWARIGLIAFWLLEIASGICDYIQNSPQLLVESTFCDISAISAISGFFAAIVLSEAVIRLIIYFAELFDRR